MLLTTRVTLRFVLSTLILQCGDDAISRRQYEDNQTGKVFADNVTLKLSNKQPWQDVVGLKLHVVVNTDAPEILLENSERTLVIDNEHSSFSVEWANIPTNKTYKIYFYVDGLGDTKNDECNADYGGVINTGPVLEALELLIDQPHATDDDVCAKFTPGPFQLTVQGSFTNPTYTTKTGYVVVKQQDTLLQDNIENQYIFKSVSLPFSGSQQLIVENYLQRNQTYQVYFMVDVDQNGICHAAFDKLFKVDVQATRALQLDLSTDSTPVTNTTVCSHFNPFPLWVAINSKQLTNYEAHTHFYLKIVDKISRAVVLVDTIDIPSSGLNQASFMQLLDNRKNYTLYLGYDCLKNLVWEKSISALDRGIKIDLNDAYLGAANSDCATYCAVVSATNPQDSFCH